MMQNEAYQSYLNQQRWIAETQGQGVNFLAHALMGNSLAWSKPEPHCRISKITYKHEYEPQTIWERILGIKRNKVEVR